MRRTALTALVALMVVLAGCGATTQGNPTTAASQTDDSTIEPTSGSYDGPTGTIAFYVSDQPAAIEDFEHLNVTITKIGLKPKATDDDGDDAETESEENETDGDDGHSTTQTATTTTSEDVNATNASSTNTSTTMSTTTTATNTSTTTTTTDESEAESADDEADDEADPEAKEGEGEDDEKDGWVTYEVDNRTVDLTELQGANATRLANLKAPNGTYTTVFVYVSEVNGTLKNGESMNVKLPSQKLQLHTTFTIGPDTETEFVYDIAVHKAGNSGKYILKPNIAESGTEVEIDDIDEKGRMDDDEMDEDEMDDEHMDENASMEGMDDDHDESESEMDDHGMNDSEDDMPDSADDEMENETADGEDMAESHGDDDGPESETDLQVAVSGTISANQSISIEVTNTDGSGVPGASVFVNDEEVGTTGADGTVSYTVPSDVEELEIEVTKGQHEGEFEVTVE